MSPSGLDLLVIAPHALAATTALALRLVGRHRAGTSDRRLWPHVWFAPGGLLLVVAAGRAGNVSILLTDIAREQARQRGWYYPRRWLQVDALLHQRGVRGLSDGAVIEVGLLLSTIALSAWQFPRRTTRGRSTSNPMSNATRRPRSGDEGRRSS